MMLYQVTVLLCSLAATPQQSDCSRQTAIVIRTAPSYAVEEWGDKGAHRCHLVAQREITMLRHDDFAKWMAGNPTLSTSSYDASQIYAVTLCEPHHEWRAPAVPDMPPALEKK